MAEYIEKPDMQYILHIKSDKKVEQRLIDYLLQSVVDVFEDTGLTADVQPVKRELVKITDSDFMTQGYLTIEKFYSCPRCGETFGNVRFSRRSQLAEMYKYCYKCGQGLDWADATKG